MPRIKTPVGDSVQAVSLTLDILEYLAQRRDAVGVTGLAADLDATKSRVHRHLQTLLARGYIVQDEASERYSIGARLTDLMGQAKANFDLANIVRPIMKRLRTNTGHSTVVSKLEPDGMRVLVMMLGESMIEIYVKEGSLLQFHASAQGKVALAFSEPSFVDEVLKRHLEKMTPETIVKRDVLKKEIQNIARRGWATAYNQTILGMNTLAAPIFATPSKLVGAVAITDSIQRICERPTERQINATVLAAKEISRALGSKS